MRLSEEDIEEILKTTVGIPNLQCVIMELLQHRKAKKISDEALAFYSDNNYEYRNFAFICQEHISEIMTEDCNE